MVAVLRAAGAVGVWGNHDVGLCLQVPEKLRRQADPAVLDAMRKAGVKRAMHWLPSGPRGPVERALARWEDAIAQVNSG